MPLAAAQGRTVAFAALASRRVQNWNRQKIDNAKLPAGAPMYFGCLTCNTLITVPEGYSIRPKLCNECQAMRDEGWL